MNRYLIETPHTDQNCRKLGPWSTRPGISIISIGAAHVPGVPESLRTQLTGTVPGQKSASTKLAFPDEKPVRQMDVSPS
jgi:hypothetical protein